MIATCGACGATFPTRSHRAKWCSDRCRKRAQRGQVVEAPPTAAEPGPAAPHGQTVETVGLLERTQAELERLDMVRTVVGQHALLLARRMEADNETLSAVSTAGQQLTRLMTVAASRPGNTDLLDEIAQRRDHKAASARRGRQ